MPAGVGSVALTEEAVTGPERRSRERSSSRGPVSSLSCWLEGPCRSCQLFSDGQLVLSAQLCRAASRPDQRETRGSCSCSTRGSFMSSAKGKARDEHLSALAGAGGRLYRDTGGGYQRVRANGLQRICTGSPTGFWVCLLLAVTEE